jgi:alkylation response protein AidB-like acyl-CoA dehydrogenase
MRHGDADDSTKLTRLSSVGETADVTGASTGGPLLDLDAYRAELARWLDGHDAVLRRQREFFAVDLADVAAVHRELQEVLYTEGWVRYGWPEDLGGLGGDARHRATLYDELGKRGVPIPEPYLTLETLIPMLSVYAPDLARANLGDLLRGAQRWCQGFSEPDAGSDLASLRTRAVRDGDDWVIDGHKIWTSHASISERCVVLLRTGTPESRHRGLSMILVDRDTPGVEFRGIRTMSGRDELGEVILDGARVDGDRLIGEVGEGWALAMYLLQWERGMYPWQRQAAMLAALDDLLALDAERVDPDALASAYLAVLPMRLSARDTIRRLAAGDTPGPEVSVDKVLLARAELEVFDLADAVLAPALELDDDAEAAEWRHHYLYSRAAPIYGGSIEIQRQILADRVLGLPRG